MIRRILRKAAAKALRRQPTNVASQRPQTQTPQQAPEAAEPEAPEPEIEVEEPELSEWMSDGQPLVFLDIREPHELQHGVAEGALIIRMNDIPESLDALPPLDTRMVVYCAAGARSFGVTHWLRENGWTDTWSLTTGYHGYLRVSDRIAAGHTSDPRAKLADLSEVGALLGASGRPRLVNHWATWCDGCIEELPMLVKLHKTFGGDVEFIGVSWDTFQGSADNAAHLQEVDRVSRQHELPWTSLVLTSSPEDLFETLAMDTQTVPQIWLIDGQGQVLHKVLEVLNEDSCTALAEKIRTLLE